MLAAYPEDLSAKAEETLKKLGVEVHTNTQVTEVGPGYVVAGGKRIDAVVTLWAAGVQASPLGKLLGVPGVELRLHGTVLYNSIYRADEQLLVNTHIYGVMASNAPVFHLRKIPGGEMASTYIESFEQVWEGATPYPGPQR